MNPVCIWNRAFRWLFAITTFFLSASFMWNTSCTFKKTVTSFMCSFKKLSPVSCSFKKLSPVSGTVSKKTVTFLCSGGETIRLFAKKKTRLQGVILTACKKTFFRVAKCWNSYRFFFFGRFFGTSLFFSLTFSQFGNFESTFYVLFFFVFSKFTPLQRILSNSNETENSFTENIWNYLKLFASVIVSLKLAAKKSRYWHKIS